MSNPGARQPVKKTAVKEDSSESEDGQDECQEEGQDLEGPN